MTQKSTEPGFLAHHADDDVAVAVHDLEPGPIEGGYLRGSQETLNLEVLDRIPLGHKIALVDLESGQDVTEYGLRVGVTTEKIAKGSYVHIHNIRSARWQNSVA